jgi:hypothetical protein
VDVEMRKASRVLARRQLSLSPGEDICPFFKLDQWHCRINQHPIPAHRLSFCQSDNYDGCPTYLGYLLRRSRPLRVDNDWFDADL